MVKDWLGVVLTVVSQVAAAEMAPEYASPDDRYKADILVIVAHPDDETQDVASYLARAVFDEHRRVAVIFTTRAEAGPSVVGNESGRALGAEREIEARRALAHFGIYNVFFIGGRHTSGTQNVLTALENMDHGAVLGEAVRLIRLTRPEVIITWLPMPVAGENHADHQAASIIANEAFDLAGDPSVLSEQLYTLDPHERVAHDPEGLQPWQPKKIFYYTDAFDAACTCWTERPLPSPYRKNFLDGAGPNYTNTEISPAKKLSYAHLSAEEASLYLSQQSTGEIALPALQRGVLGDFEAPTRFVLGKTLVGGGPTDDVFAGITPEGISFQGPSRAPVVNHSGVSLEAGGPWDFYRHFWSAHHLDRVAGLLPVPEFSAHPGQRIDVPLIIRNATGDRRSVGLNAILPRGWTEVRKYTEFPLSAQSRYLLHSALKVPSGVKAGWYEVEWTIQNGQRQIGSVKWRVYVTSMTSSGTQEDDPWAPPGLWRLSLSELKQ